MNSSVGNEIITGFIEEVEGYLPDMSRCLETLQQDRIHRPSLAELHRITHTIKGAAAMVGLDDLSAFGELLEKVMENILGSSLDVDDEILSLLGEATQHIDQYCVMQHNQDEGNPHDSHLFLQRRKPLEEKLNSTKFAKSAQSSASTNPENIFFDDVAEDNFAGDTLNSQEVNSVDDLFADVEPEISKGAEDSQADGKNENFCDPDIESIFDEIPLATSQEDESESIFGSEVETASLSELIDPELLECFREETEEHLENIDRCLDELANQITDLVALTPPTQETLHSLRRSVHTLKGAAAVIGIEQIAAWGHDFEDFLDWLHDEAKRLDPATVVALRDGADLLASLADNPSVSIEKDKQRILTKFNDITERMSFTVSPVSGNTLADDLTAPSAPSSISAASFLFEETEAEESIETVLPLAQDSVADFFSETDEEKSEETDSFFDEFTADTTSATDTEEEDLFFQDVEEKEEDDFFGSITAESGKESSTDKSETVDEYEQENIDEELLQCFHEEAEEHLDNLDRQVNHLNITISDKVELTDLSRGTLHSIRRSVHTLKGAAAVIGIEQIAAWGHDFEDFLDWLHDEAQSIYPDIVQVMQEGSDILVRLVEDPTCSVITAQHTVQEKFQRIIAKAKERKKVLPDALEENFEEKNAVDDEAGEKKATTAPVQQQRKKSATLRVDVNRVDQLVGLSGDMVINLSSFEDSMDTMSGTTKELDMILQRLKNINSSLEAGYELASIPHLGSSEDGQISGIAEDFDPLEMDRYSELNILIRSLTEAVSDLDSIMGQNALDTANWQETIEHQGMILKDLQNRMMGIRMTPFSTLSSRMHRTVREAERTTGHPAQLTIKGESIMMDTRVWEIMADPLMHILRNAVAHGGSLPQAGESKGNREGLSITIQARRRWLCILQVSDTGKGLDYQAIRIKGMKLYPNERVNLMSDSELADLIFRHGFSSTGAITNIAGRGVGMDVVRDAVDQLKGSIELISERGQGTEFIMRLPVAVAQLPAILARFGNQVYAIPMHDVASVVRATAKEKKAREYTFDGDKMLLLHPAEIPGFETDRVSTQKKFTENDQALIIVHTGGKRAAMLCEQLVGQRDIVFKDLGNHLHNVPCVSGVTIMGDGSLIPILQVEEVLRTWSAANKKQQAQGHLQRPVKERTLLRVLVVDDSISVRKVVSNLITQQGWMPIAARNGIEAIEKIREEKPDIVLLDVEMPRMNGFEVLQALQAQPELHDIPVAMLTSRSAEKYQTKARELGARGFMTKPFKADEVISFIRKVTPDKQL
ncbi:Hpt domain-containing protein [Desulfobulbus sp. TB]|nr:Hpt domain-containing protein [Desulfobulbus sp. TB]